MVQFYILNKPLIIITVFTNFSFEKLRSADADVTGTVRRVPTILDLPRHSRSMLPQKLFDFLRLRNAISCILGAVQTKNQFHKQ